MRTWVGLILTALVIAAARLAVISYFKVTGIQVVPEALVRVGYWLQFLLLALGVALRRMEQLARQQDKRYDR